MKRLLGAALLLITGVAAAQTPQNPSPMVETTREHRRLTKTELAGERWTIGEQAESASLFLPETFAQAPEVDLVVHYHGASWLPELSAARQSVPVATATIVRGPGPPLEELIDGAAVHLAPRRIGRIFLTAFSAGYRPIRGILRTSVGERVAGVLLLDGLHASYVPERTVLADGGTIDPEALEPFVTFARLAMHGERIFIITHSEIFPGTFASTTEMTDALLAALGLPRTAVLAWGPVGMQQLSKAAWRNFHVFGFAGNSAPDHVDHFHAMPEMLEMLLAKRVRTQLAPK